MDSVSSTQDPAGLLLPGDFLQHPGPKRSQLLHSLTPGIPITAASPAPLLPSSGLALLASCLKLLLLCRHLLVDLSLLGMEFCQQPVWIRWPKCSRWAFCIERGQAVEHKVSKLSRFAQDFASFPTDCPMSRETCSAGQTGTIGHPVQRAGGCLVPK